MVRKNHKIIRKPVVRRPTRAKKNAKPVSEQNFDIDIFYKNINKVQVEGETMSFIVKPDDSGVIENILKDLTLEFTKKAKGSSFVYTVSPSRVKHREVDFNNVENLPDEILEDGQLF